MGSHQLCLQIFCLREDSEIRLFHKTVSRFQPSMGVFHHTTLRFYGDSSMNPDTALFSTVVSSPPQAPGEVSALSGGLHQGLTKQMLTVGCTAGILNHISSNQMEQADVHGSTSALQAG